MATSDNDRRVKLIFNAHADNGRGWRVAGSLQATIERMGGADWTGTEYPSHASALAQEAASDGYDVVAAVGGDGTVHEVVNGLMQVPSDSRPMLAAVPIGTGNDFCANAGLKTDPDEAMIRVFSGEPRSMDIGMVHDDSGRTEYWDNSLGIGLEAATVINSHSLTWLKGMPMYFVAAIMAILKDHEAPRFDLTVDGQRIDGEYLVLALCNGAREGGGFLMAPDALPDDGILDYIMIEWLSRPMTLLLMPEVMRGTHLRFKQVHPGRFRKLELKADRPLLIHTDGELFAKASTNVRELTVQVLPGALNLIT